jgi:RND superfamily putative drug exporter
VVRSLLVPALVRELGGRAWWPSRLGRRAGDGAGDPAKVPALVRSDDERHP